MSYVGWMCFCTCECVHVNMSTCVCVCMFTCLCVHDYTHVEHMCMHVIAHMYICV